MIELIKKVPLFAQLNEQQLNALAEICTKTSLIKRVPFLFSEKEIGSVFLYGLQWFC